MLIVPILIAYTNCLVLVRTRAPPSSGPFAHLRGGISGLTGKRRAPIPSEIEVEGDCCRVQHLHARCEICQAGGLSKLQSVSAGNWSLTCSRHCEKLARRKGMPSLRCALSGDTAAKTVRQRRWPTWSNVAE